MVQAHNQARLPALAPLNGSFQGPPEEATRAVVQAIHDVLEGVDLAVPTVCVVGLHLVACDQGWPELRHVRRRLVPGNREQLCS